MTREEIESVYSRDVLDRNWWGNFPEPLDLLGKDFPKTADIYRLMPVCARIALHMGGELPRIIFSKEGGARMDFNSVVMNPEILSLKVSEQVRAEVFFGQYIHQVGHICYSRGVYEKYRCTLQQKYFIHLIEDRRIEGRIARVYPGYYYYLNAARRMQFTLALLRAEQELKFTDLDDVRYNYLATRSFFLNCWNMKCLKPVCFLTGAGWDGSTAYWIRLRIMLPWNHDKWWSWHNKSVPVL